MDGSGNRLDYLQFGMLYIFYFVFSSVHFSPISSSFVFWISLAYDSSHTFCIEHPS